MDITKLIHQLEALYDINIYSIFYENFVTYENHIIHEDITSLYYVSNVDNSINKIAIHSSNIKTLLKTFTKNMEKFKIEGISKDEDFQIFKEQNKPLNTKIVPITEYDNIPNDIKDLVSTLENANILLYGESIGNISITLKNGTEIFVPSFNMLKKIYPFIDNVYKSFFWNTIFEKNNKLIDSYGNEVLEYDNTYISLSKDRIWIGNSKIEIDNFNNIKSIHISKTHDHDLFMSKLFISLSDSLISKTNKHLSSPLF